MEIEGRKLTKEDIGRLVTYIPNILNQKTEVGILVNWNDNFVFVDYFTQHTKATSPEDLRWDDHIGDRKFKRTPYKVLNSIYNGSNEGKVVYIEESKHKQWRGPWFWGFFYIPEIDRMPHDKVRLKKLCYIQ